MDFIRWGGPYDSFMDLEKLFDGPNVAGGIIDMVQLPDIFLRHPTVLVQVGKILLFPLLVHGGKILVSMSLLRSKVNILCSKQCYGSELKNSYPDPARDFAFWDPNPT